MTIKNRHTNTRRVNLNIVVFKDFLRLPDHLHFFFGVAIVHNLVNLRHRIKGNLRRHNVHFNRLPIEQACGLRRQLFNPTGARTRNRLVRGDINSCNAYRVMNWLQSSNHLNGRAVWVGDNITRGVIGHPMGVYLRHYQWNFVVITKARCIIDNHTPLGRSFRCKFGRNISTGRKQTNFRLAEIKFIQPFDHDRFAMKLQAFAFRSL